VKTEANPKTVVTFSKRSISIDGSSSNSGYGTNGRNISNNCFEDSCKSSLSSSSCEYRSKPCDSNKNTRKNHKRSNKKVKTAALTMKKANILIVVQIVM
jgi:hypothetical protein